MTRMQRLVANIFGSWFQLRRHFPGEVLDALAHAVGEGEKHHLGEVRFALEARLPPLDVWSGLTPRQRAEQVFAQLGIWNTEHNSGVLIYVLLAERRIEIVVDRGLAACVDAAEWDRISAAMRAAFAAGRWREGSLSGIASVHALTRVHFPSDGRNNPDELPDRPVLL